MIHLFGFALAEHLWVGRRTMTATFHGVSAQPFVGTQRPRCLGLACQGLGVLRQQMPSNDRVNVIIAGGGNRPSVIPDTATMSVYVRSLLPDGLLDLSVRVDGVLEGAVQMAGVGFEREWDIHPTRLPVRNNRALTGQWTRTQLLRDRTALGEGIFLIPSPPPLTLEMSPI